MQKEYRNKGTDNWDRRSQPKETKPSFLSLRTTHSNGTNFLLPQSFSSLPSSHSLSSSARTHYTKPCQSCDPANNFIQFLGHHAGYYRLPHTVDARESNLIFVEQPTGTGFSYSFSANDTHHNEESISNDLYDFLQVFFKQHGDYANNDFYITGESYAGHYSPAFASWVDKGNKAKEGIFINLKGFAIGNGLTNPAIQFDAYADFALYMKLINQSEYSNVTDLVPPCEQAIQACATCGSTSTCTVAFNVCIDIKDEVLHLNGNNLNVYDIRKQREGPLFYVFSKVVEFLNQKAANWMKNLEGNYRWVNLMQWSGQNNFTTAAAVPFVVDGALGGIMKSYGSLTFLKCWSHGSNGSTQAALEMLKRWTQGTLTVAGDQSNIPISDFELETRAKEQQIQLADAGRYHSLVLIAPLSTFLPLGL
ncbi:unnamed protein product [Camellia sinensis]